MTGLIRLLALFLAVFLTGCASTQALKDSDRQALQAVRVDGPVVKLSPLYLVAPGNSVAMMFGAIGGGIAGAANIGPAQALQDFAAKNGITIEKIAREEIEAALKASGKVVFVPAGAKISAAIGIEVEQFGFSVPSLISSKVVPVLALRCQMVDQAGRVIWSAGDRVLPSVLTAVDSVSFEEMKNDPGKIEAAWRQAARIVAENIAKSL